MSDKTRLFRQLIEVEDILIQPGICDGLVQQMGVKSASIFCDMIPAYKRFDGSWHHQGHGAAVSDDAAVAGEVRVAS